MKCDRDCFHCLYEDCILDYEDFAAEADDDGLPPVARPDEQAERARKQREKTLAAPHGSAGQYLRRARKRMGLTQGQMAAALGVSGVTVCRWESGRVKMPPRIPQTVRELEAAANTRKRRKNHGRKKKIVQQRGPGAGAH